MRDSAFETCYEYLTEGERECIGIYGCFACYDCVVPYRKEGFLTYEDKTAGNDGNSRNDRDSFSGSLCCS